MLKNTLKIWIGTPCHLMGAADLLEAVENLDYNLRKKLGFARVREVAAGAEISAGTGSH